MPGDIVIGNENGVLFLPSHMVDFVIENAFKMQARDLYAFPRLKAGQYTTADVDAPVWPLPMLRDPAGVSGAGPGGGALRGMDWSLELRAAQGDPGSHRRDAPALRH